MISSFGESALPVAQAGQTSWQRPHSVHENVSSICFQVRSATVPAPKRSSSSALLVEVERLEPAACARAAEEDVDRRRSRCAGASSRGGRRGSRGSIEHVRPHEDALERLGRRRRRRTGARARSRPATSPPATRSGRARSAWRARAGASTTIPAISAEDQVRLAEVAALEPRRALHLADRRTPPTHADEHQHREQVDQEREPALVRRATGSSQSRSTARSIAITIVGNRTTKPQKMNACIRPGPSRWKQLPLAEHDHGLVPDPRRDVVERAAPACRAGRAGRAAARGGRTAPPATSTTASRARARRASHLSRLAPLASRPRSPARTSCRSPITA